MGNGGGGVMSRPYNTQRWKLTRLLVLRRDNYKCHWCGAVATQCDHLRSPIEGGPVFDPANLVAACRTCNASRGAHLTNARKAGAFFGARRGSTPQAPITESVHESPVLGAIRLES